MALPAPSPELVLITQWAILGLTALAIVARLNLRLMIQKRRLLVSDMMICGALMAAIANAAFDIKMTQMGALEPDVMTTLEGFDGDVKEKSSIMKLYWISYFPYFITFYLSKGALLAMYRKLVPYYMVKRRIFLFFTTGFVICSYIATLMLEFCSCLPIERNWSQDPEKVCTAKDMIHVFQAAWGLHNSGDLLVFLIPWVVIADLELQRTMRIGIYGTFLLGIIDMACSLFRFIAIQTSVRDGTLPLSLNELCSSLDCNIGVLVASLPSLRPYFGGKNRSSDITGSESFARSANSRSDSRNSNGDGQHVSGLRTINQPQHPSLYQLSIVDEGEFDDLGRRITGNAQLVEKRPSGGKTI